MDSFSAQQSPPLIEAAPAPAAPAQQEGALELRGGNGDEDFLLSRDSEDTRPHAQRAQGAIEELDAVQHRVTPRRERRLVAGNDRELKANNAREFQLTQIARTNFDYDSIQSQQNNDLATSTADSDSPCAQQVEGRQQPLQGEESDHDEHMADDDTEPRENNGPPPIVNNVYTQQLRFLSATQVLRRKQRS